METNKKSTKYTRSSREAATAQQEGWVKTIFDGMSDMMVAIDTDYCLVAYNNAYQKEFNAAFGKEIAIGMSLEEAMEDMPEKLEKAKERWSLALQGEDFIFVKPSEIPGQQETYHELAYRCIRNKEGIIIGASYLARDISDRIRAEKEVKLMQEFIALADAIPQIVWTSRPDGIKDFVNKWASSFTGYPKEELLEKGWQRFIHPDDAPTYAYQLKQLVDSGSQFEAEYRLLSKDNVYRWHIGRAVPVTNKQGEVVRFIGTATDIHENKVLLEKFELKVRELEQVSEAIPQLVWKTGVNGNANYFNRQWYDYTGLTAQQSLNDGWLSAIHPEDQEGALSALQHSFSSGTPFQFEFRLLRSDGIYHWFISMAVPFRNHLGEIVQWFGTCTDIHEQKLQRDELNNKNQKLFQINSYLDEFVHAVAHDLRSPVAGLKLSFELLKQVDESKQDKIIKGCEAFLDRLDNTLKGLVQLIEVQEDSQQSFYEQIDVQQVIEGIVLDLKEKLMSAGASVKNGHFEWRTIRYPKSYIYNILRNIIRYTLRFRDESHPLRLEIATRQTRDGFYMIEVQDNGPGINLEKERKYLFKPFSHINKGSDQQGMGLAIVKHMVEKNGGYVDVSSSLGKGTCFQLYLKEYI
ncbi:PAS domain-containing protein [Nafulsella turpanensis]|uniref:PAS domain-containing protein n=1 Tax=Nafulsella turpanensis TaxID=1265690 RepID=UPI000363C27C|nr:PAS domain-containing sensor histidine kinase [Nafulsella turpanensis]